MNRNRMCPVWEKTGACPNGAACLFAHGEAALQHRMAAGLLGGQSGGQGGGGSGGGGGGGGVGGDDAARGEKKAEGGEKGDGPVCLCLKPFSGCRVWPIALSAGVSGTHAVRPGQTSGVNNCDSTMLGNLSQFCASFFHANSWEVPAAWDRT